MYILFIFLFYFLLFLQVPNTTFSLCVVQVEGSAVSWFGLKKEPENITFNYHENLHNKEQGACKVFLKRADPRRYTSLQTSLLYVLYRVCNLKLLISKKFTFIPVLAPGDSLSSYTSIQTAFICIC